MKPEALLSGRANEQVRVGLTARVKMLRDVLDVEDLSEFLDAGALAGMLVQQ
jgi:hypothetical protein